MSTSDSVAIRAWPIAWVPRELAEPVLVGDGLGVAEVLDDLQRAPEREHLGVPDPLDGVGQRLQVAVEAEDDRHRARRVLDVLDPAPAARMRASTWSRWRLHALLEVGVVVGRLAQLHVHDEAVGVAAVERVAGRVRAPVLHRLEHRGHVAPHLALATAVAVDDPGDPAHAGRLPQGRTSRYSLALPVGDRRQVALPLVALVVAEHLVEAAGHRLLDQLVAVQRLEGRARGARARARTRRPPASRS